MNKTWAWLPFCAQLQFKLLLNYSLYYQKSSRLPLCSPPQEIYETATIVHFYIYCMTKTWAWLLFCAQLQSTFSKLQKSNRLPLCSPPQKISETATIVHSYIIWLKHELGCFLVLNYSLHYQKSSRLPLCSPPQKIPETATIVHSYLIWLKLELGCLFVLDQIQFKCQKSSQLPWRDPILNQLALGLSLPSCWFSKMIPVLTKLQMGIWLQLRCWLTLCWLLKWSHPEPASIGLVATIVLLATIVSAP